MPTVDAISLPAGVTRDDMAKLLDVDRNGWKAEIADVRANHYPKFGDRLPKELSQELVSIEKRLA
jgi:phosphoenolpyruvate carboxykinase (GTP)